MTFASAQVGIGELVFRLVFTAMCRMEAPDVAGGAGL